MLNNSGQSLSAQLDPQVLTALQAYLASRNLSIDRFSGVKPWAISLMITMLEYQHLGMQSKYGVEQHYYQQAKLDNKRITWLESFDEQITFLSSMEQVEPNTMLKYTLEDLQELPSFSKFF